MNLSIQIFVLLLKYEGCYNYEGRNLHGHEPPCRVVYEEIPIGGRLIEMTLLPMDTAE